MGFTPAEVNAMSAWEWAAAASGFAEAHRDPADRSGEVLTDDEFDAASKMLDT
jgi:hypothetical protein